ncbi:hypothetical protein ABZ234_01400 [Nocardiopsis sp. NPDC006198]|uniref:hypothetical protein n=1 Tax=Nocardiopsis sp. NPDC006198 TaxID=3154472 RepID=UPI0033B168B9
MNSQDVPGGRSEVGVGTAQPEQHCSVGLLQVEVDADDVENRAVRRNWAALLPRGAPLLRGVSGAAGGVAAGAVEGFDFGFGVETQVGSYTSAGRR